MIIADKLKSTNRAEYLLYMWQVEDLLRAYHCNEEQIQNEYVSRFKLSDEQSKQTNEWYANLCEMMRTEGKRENGHLQICQNILQELNELHLQLVASSRFPYYREMYYKVLPYIVELRSKHKDSPQPENTTKESELQTCFELLYGVIMLRLQKKEVTSETQKAVKDTSMLLGQLSDYYFKDKAEPIEF